MKVKTNEYLKIGENELLPKGSVFDSSLGEFPDYIQDLVAINHKSITILEDDFKFVPPEEPVGSPLINLLDEAGEDTENSNESSDGTGEGADNVPDPVPEVPVKKSRKVRTVKPHLGE